MENFTTKQKVIIIIGLLLLLLFIGYRIISKTEENNYTVLEETVENNIIMQENQNEQKRSIIVHIVGCVETEGIVELEEGARIADVIEKAGGTTEHADTSKINLAYLVSDGQKIKIPSINEPEVTEYISTDAGENIVEGELEKSTLVNINTATQTELETLSGIGPSTALKIIEYRKENGQFSSIEEIKEVTGIGEAKYESIKDYICIK